MRDTALSAAQKRTLFKSRFGEILLENGFVWCKDRYVRVHEGEIQLSVGLQIARRGLAFIGFGAVPFCLGTIDWESLWGERIEQFIPSGSERSSFGDAGFEDQLDQCLRLFRDTLFTPFNALRDVRSLLDYQENQLLPALRYMDHTSAYHICLQLEDWDSAKTHLSTLIAVYDEALDSVRREEAAELRIATSERCKVQIRASSADRRERILRERSQLQKDLDLLNSGTFHPLQERILQNISVSQDASRKLYPRAWR